MHVVPRLLQFFQSGYIYNETCRKPCARTTTVDFGEVKTTTTECKKKFFEMMSHAYLHCSKAPQNKLMLMIHLRKRSAR